mgnify:CR=1 FL=1
MTSSSAEIRRLRVAIGGCSHGYEASFLEALGTDTPMPG